MKRLLLFVALTVVVSGGCKKSMDKLENSAYNPQPAAGPAPAAAQGGGQAGGGGGAVMAVRARVTREEARVALEQIRLFIDAASNDGNMPSVETTYAALQREAPKYAKYVADQQIVLNRARTREDVWAYSEVVAPNLVLVASASGIEEMTPAALQQRLGR